MHQSFRHSLLSGTANGQNLTVVHGDIGRPATFNVQIIDEVGFVNRQKSAILHLLANAV